MQHRLAIKGALKHQLDALLAQTDQVVDCNDTRVSPSHLNYPTYCSPVLVRLLSEQVQREAGVEPLGVHGLGTTKPSDNVMHQQEGNNNFTKSVAQSSRVSLWLWSVATNLNQSKLGAQDNKALI